MPRKDFDPAVLLNIPLWEEVQDRIARITGTAIITVDYKGNPITRHSSRTDFCGLVREDPVFHKRCIRCDALAGLEAVRQERPFIYLCHCGIVDVAVPIMVGERYLGAVMFGQVRMRESEANGKVQRLVSEISRFSGKESQEYQDHIRSLYYQLPEMAYSRIVEIADFLKFMVHYIVEQALSKDQSEDISAWQQRNGVAIPDSMPAEPLDTLPFKISRNSAIYPAVDYINTNPYATVTMSQMADLCHLSPSYFSRLFAREAGESFISYANRQKIQIAKKQLRDTSKSITQIAGELGYLNTSHFINLFKRFEGVTPLIYRQKKIT